jgi:hypothetical protein
MPPQQSYRLLDFFDGAFGFSAHPVRMVAASAVVKQEGARA